jgi:hypothetical protein
MDGYSAIALEDIAMFVQNDGIRNNETYEELTKEKKLRVANKTYKSEKIKWERRI